MKRWLAWLLGLVVGGALVGFASEPALAQDAAEEAVPTAAEAVEAASGAKFVADNLWIMIAGMLVFMMHLGFATLEAGLTRAKNTVNILFKNTFIICIGIITYAIIGFNLMYPGEGSVIPGVLGFGGGLGFLLDGHNVVNDASRSTSAYADYTWFTDFFFQAMFAATAATIVSGAVAERIKLLPFLVFISLLVAISYPITGSWKWGGLWLDEFGFYDFAGSTIVHAVGGFAALGMVILLGPRKGKYNPDGTSNAIPGHNMPLACVGVFLLWFGWFGFNGGSVLSADPGLVSLVLVTTSCAAACGGLSAGTVSAIAGGKPDLTMALNGVLAGLVGITAGADTMGVWQAMLVGIIAGVIVYFSVIFLDNALKIDDPVGAISVHGVCGIWGTLAVAIFGSREYLGEGVGTFVPQIVGILSMGLFTLAFTLVVGGIIKATMGLRVSDEEQIEGLDLGEHDMAAYPDFQHTTIKSYQLREM